MKYENKGKPTQERHRPIKNHRKWAMESNLVPMKKPMPGSIAIRNTLRDKNTIIP
jgi:hypothetical protein